MNEGISVVAQATHGCINGMEHVDLTLEDASACPMPDDNDDDDDDGDDRSLENKILKCVEPLPQPLPS